MRVDRDALKAYAVKVEKDNIRFLVSAVAWNILLSAVPMAIGMIALSEVLFGNSTQKREVVRNLSRAFQGVLGPHYLDRVVHLTVQHSGWLLLLALLTALWGAWNVGFALSNAFDAMFEVGSRPFLREKLIDLSMFFALVVLAYLIVSITSAHGMISDAISSLALPHAAVFLATTLVSGTCAFVLFAILYIVYPNTETRLRISRVWQGALLAAVLFQLLTFIWPLYESHFSKYGGILFPFLVLVLWVYFFSLILVIGAEVVAVSVVHEARKEGREVGPPPDGSVPQHRTLAQSRKAG